MAELRPNIVFHGRHLGICNPICVKLLQVMSGVISSNLKEKRRLYLSRFSRSTNAPYTHTHIHTDTDTDTHTHAHDDGKRRNVMRCISSKNDPIVGMIL